MLHVLRVSHLDYLSYLVCGLCQKKNSCLSFVRHLYLGVTAKTPFARDLQKVRGSWIWWWHLFYILCLTIIFITEPCAHFLLSLLEGLTIDFPSHFILSFIDVYKDTMTRDKFIFPSAITRIIRHAFVSYPKSALLGTYFYVIGLSFDKTHFICIWVNLSRFKMIITSG